MEISELRSVTSARLEITCRHGWLNCIIITSLCFPHHIDFSRKFVSKFVVLLCLLITVIVFTNKYLLEFNFFGCSVWRLYRVILNYIPCVKGLYPAPKIIPKSSSKHTVATTLLLIYGNRRISPNTGGCSVGSVADCHVCT